MSITFDPDIEPRSKHPVLLKHMLDTDYGWLKDWQQRVQDKRAGRQNEEQIKAAIAELHEPQPEAALTKAQLDSAGEIIRFQRLVLVLMLLIIIALSIFALPEGRASSTGEQGAFAVVAPLPSTVGADLPADPPVLWHERWWMRDELRAPRSNDPGGHVEGVSEYGAGS